MSKKYMCNVCGKMHNDWDDAVKCHPDVITVESEVYPEKKGETCGICGKGFTDTEWEDRHSEGLDEFHAKHCPKCEPDKAFFITLRNEQKANP